MDSASAGYGAGLLNRRTRTFPRSILDVCGPELTRVTDRARQYDVGPQAPRAVSMSSLGTRSGLRLLAADGKVSPTSRSCSSRSSSAASSYGMAGSCS